MVLHCSPSNSQWSTPLRPTFPPTSTSSSPITRLQRLALAPSYTPSMAVWCSRPTWALEPTERVTWTCSVSSSLCLSTHLALTSLPGTDAMGLVHPQPVGLYQVGDEVQGASFNNLLDALDGSFCQYQGGDDPTQGSPPRSYCRRRVKS